MQNSGETQKALWGPRSQGVLTPYPSPTGKAALILFSQRICRPEGRGLPGPKSLPHLGALRSEIDGQAGVRVGDPEQGGSFPISKGELGEPHGGRKKANPLQPRPSTEQMWTMARTQKAL